MQLHHPVEHLQPDTKYEGAITLRRSAGKLSRLEEAIHADPVDG